jgi:hypothetical protein
VVAVCSLTLMILLVVGAAGYAAVRGTSWTAAGVARQPAAADRAREADLITLLALALGLIGVLMLAVATTPARIELAARRRTQDLPPADSNLEAAASVWGRTPALPPGAELQSEGRANVNAE